jgi:hypothetical protein
VSDLPPYDLDAGEEAWAIVPWIPFSIALLAAVASAWAASVPGWFAGLAFAAFALWALAGVMWFVLFTISGFCTGCGFAYLPRESSPRPDFEHVDGPWYRWCEQSSD